MPALEQETAEMGLTAAAVFTVFVLARAAGIVGVNFVQISWLLPEVTV